MAKLVIGVFTDRMAAEDAIENLEERGYNPKDISILMKDRRQANEFASNTGADVVGGTLSGVATGGVLGALAGLLVATGVIPGLGAILIGGPLAAALGLTGAAATTVSGAATGAIAGGILGALTSLGLSDEDARVYEESIRAGGILVAVPARMGEEAEVRDVIERYGADQVKTIDQLETSSRRDYEEREVSPAYYSEIDRDEPRRGWFGQSRRHSRARRKAD